MKTPKFIVATLGLLILSTQNPQFVLADLFNAATGSVRVFVQDDAGQSVTNAPVYLLDGHKNLMVLKTDASGSLTLTLPAGKYTLSSAVTRPIADSLDRYASPEAHIEVLAKDSMSLVLSLQLADDAISNLSLSTLQKMGVANQVAKYLN